MGSVKPLPRARIVSDGTGPGTHLYDAEGNEILRDYIKSIAWEISGPGKLARVRLELTPAELEVEGELASVEADVVRQDHEDVKPIWSVRHSEVTGEALKTWLTEQRSRDIGRFF